MAQYACLNEHLDSDDFNGLCDCPDCASARDVDPVSRDEAIDLIRYAAPADAERHVDELAARVGSEF